ncbi:hypothetical protein ACLB2K_000381 [Fragaria x ananassa]
MTRAPSTEDSVRRVFVAVKRGGDGQNGALDDIVEKDRDKLSRRWNSSNSVDRNGRELLSHSSDDFNDQASTTISMIDIIEKMSIDDESSVYVGGLPYYATEDSVRVDLYGAVIAVKTFYTVGYFNELLSFDVTSQSYSEILVIVPEDKPIGQVKRYIFEGEGKKLFMVQRYTDYVEVEEGFRNRVTKKFRVFELNSAKHEWVEKNSLGDIAVFVGDNSSISVLPKSFRMSVGLHILQSR